MQRSCQGVHAALMTIKCLLRCGLWYLMQRMTNMTTRRGGVACCSGMTCMKHTTVITILNTSIPSPNQKFNQCQKARGCTEKTGKRALTSTHLIDIWLYNASAAVHGGPHLTERAARSYRSITSALAREGTLPVVAGSTPCRRAKVGGRRGGGTQHVARQKRFIEIFAITDTVRGSSLSTKLRRNKGGTV